MGINETAPRGKEVVVPAAAPYRMDVMRVRPQAHSLAASLREALCAPVEIDGAYITDKELKTLLPRVSEAMLEGIVLCGPRGEIVYLNDSLCQTLGRTHEELVGCEAT